MVWRARKRDQFTLASTRHILPAWRDENPDIWFVIDGQQRLSVLWQVLRGSGNTVTNARQQIIDFAHLYFDASPGPDRDRFIYRLRQPSELHVPVVDVLSSGWRRKCAHLGERARSRVEECPRAAPRVPFLDHLR